jgi:hypothetical protein
MILLGGDLIDPLGMTIPDARTRPEDFRVVRG